MIAFEEYQFQLVLRCSGAVLPALPNAATLEFAAVQCLNCVGPLSLNFEMLRLSCLRDCKVLSHKALQVLLDADGRAHHGRYCHIAPFQCVAWTFWSLSTNSTYPRHPEVFAVVLS